MGTSSIISPEFIQTFPNTKALLVQFPIIRPIQRCCLDNRRGHGNNGSKIMMHTAYGFRWAYTSDNIIIHDRTTVKPVLQLDRNSGEVLNTYKTIKEASIITNTSREGIYDCVNGVAIVAGGYKWRYRDLPTPITPEHKLKRTIVQMDKQYNILNTFESIAEAARSVNSNVTSIGKVCRGEMATAAGFKWSYKNNPIPIRSNNSERAVIQMDMDYNIINEFISIKEASIQTGVGASNISGCCNGRLTAGGYRWWYKDTPIVRRVKGSCRKSITQMDMNCNTLNEFDSLTTASKITGVSMASISQACNGKLTSARGYKWKYTN